MIRPGIWRRELAVPLQSIQTELNRLFDEYWRPPGEPGGPGDGSDGMVEPDVMNPSAWTPAIDLWESPGELTLVVDLPGVAPASMDLSLAGNVLTLKGVKLAPTVPDPGASSPARGRVKERTAGNFHREITLIEEVDFDKVEAQTRDGVLIVRLPKRAAGPARTIPIQPATS